MEGILSEVGIGFLVAYLIIKEFVFFFRRDANTQDAKKSAKYLEDLWEWHAKEDEDGRKIWYNRQSVEKAIIEISEYTKTLTSIFKSMNDMLKDNHTTLIEMKSDFHVLQKDVSDFIKKQ